MFETTCDLQVKLTDYVLWYNNFRRIRSGPHRLGRVQKGRLGFLEIVQIGPSNPDASLCLARLAILGLRIWVARDFASALYRPLVDCLRVEDEFSAAFRDGPFRRDYIARGLTSELVGVFGG